MRYRGLFVGLVTLDVIYHVEQMPSSNQKVVALDSALAAGGPATNAAVTFAYLGDRAVVASVLGRHPSAALIRSDLELWNVVIADLQPLCTDAPPTSSILVTQATGERAVVSRNAVQRQATVAQIPSELRQGECHVVLIDGHQMAVGEAIAIWANAKNIPVVVDGGSWKPGFESVLQHANYAICSANFYPPGCDNADAVINQLHAWGVPHAAITQGEAPIQVSSQGKRSLLPVPAVPVVDTLGAGDVIHGAFCHFILRQGFEQAIASAAIVAARSCQHFGTRQWMQPP